jgi:uncharacterized membrane protein HdeD (DUF308 family)
MVDLPIVGIVSRRWWVLALRGVAACLFAVSAFAWPGLTLGVLVLLWGAFAFVDGVAALVAGIGTRWWSVVFFGVVGIAVGLYALFRPAMTALALILVIAAWAIVRGVLEIAAAIALRKELSNEWLLVLAGVLSIAFGVCVAAFPGAGALSLVWLVGAQALVIGLLWIWLAFRLRGLTRLDEAHA